MEIVTHSIFITTDESSHIYQGRILVSTSHKCFDMFLFENRYQNYIQDL